jgi:hypothetical protein
MTGTAVDCVPYVTMVVPCGALFRHRGWFGLTEYPKRLCFAILG